MTVLERPLREGAAQAKFTPGQVVMTRGLFETFTAEGEDPRAYLRRHVRGDWGEVKDPEENNQALKEGARLLSVYRTKAGERFWIITEADRSATTFLYPHEY